MKKDYSLEVDIEKTIGKLDMIPGVRNNKKVLRNMIIYSKLKKDGLVDFGNYNIIVRNNSSYNLLNNLLELVGEVLEKNNIIPNSNIYYLEKTRYMKSNEFQDKISKIDESIIVINSNDLKCESVIDYKNIEKVVNMNNNKVFIFEDSDICEGKLDSKIGNIASWKMNINSISVYDKVTYLKNMLTENGINYKNQELRKFVNKPFWELKSKALEIVIDCKSKGIKKVDSNYLNKIDTESILSKKYDTILQAIENYEEDMSDKYAKDEMKDLIGLTEIKEEVYKIINYVKVNNDRGEKPSLHFCFTGNPGTGKTSIARVIGKIFKEQNILKGGEFVEIHGRDLVGQYVGHTALKVHQIVKKATGGVLFIDEAYSLVSDRRGLFEDEAIATLIKEMEDHRDEICIILAGYTSEMKDLIERNPGFKSRIQFELEFPDYTEEELYQIFELMYKKEKFKLSKGSKELIMSNFSESKNIKDFGNGRYVRNLFEKIKFEQANRIVKTNSKNLNMITISDVENALKGSLKASIKKEYGFRKEL